VTRYVSEALAKQDRAGFSSGNKRTDRCFQTTVSQDFRRNYATCPPIAVQGGKCSLGSSVQEDLPADLRQVEEFPDPGYQDVSITSSAAWWRLRQRKLQTSPERLERHPWVSCQRRELARAGSRPVISCTSRFAP
jgi:hypothetical protein